MHQLPLLLNLVDFLPAHLFDQLHDDWKLVLQDCQHQISHLESRLIPFSVTPDFANIFRALSTPIDEAKVVIFGQDPYPTKGHAHGLAFSVSSDVNPLPPSLRNIFKELTDDLDLPLRENGDLTDWVDQGVVLINRILSTQIGQSLAHQDYGWQEITDRVAQELGNRDVVAILWGKSAQELSHHFRDDWIIESVHPSPLSAYRGFFGSNPFSKCNQILAKNDISPIKWA